VKRKVIFILFPIILFSKSLGIEAGVCKYSIKRNFFDVLYEKNTPIKNLPTYTTLAIGGWENKYGSDFIALGEGVTIGNKFLIKMDISLCYITNTTKHLSTHFEFKDRIRFGYKLNKIYSFFIGWIHFSNGGIKEPNTGENFIIMCLMRNF